ncbi:(2Fe-2S)-binding protein [Vulgatibacter incomptus]|uniref:BFD-like [2Fe-2S]-binding domain-containing protein n=1 Tax=Vulgatibacter incomptus TaxID=1391653 RepID=A0A0K1PEQ5_9BACT|nr:(2Fe-2S)-binding protein [Vulgatibacter incomptus]AKU91896.1 hypothetical protein AKJ08_2283 [Vulgatibacter incomptus]
MGQGDELEDEDWDEPGDDWPSSFGPPLVLVCRCHCVEEREIEALIAEGADLAEIARRTGATTGCSGCRRQIESMLRAR